MTNEQQNLSWLQQEAEQLKNTTGKYEELEALPLKDGTIVTFTVDTETPFGEYRKDENSPLKKIIKVTHKGVRKNLWLNVKNPLYKQIVDLLVTGQREFTVSTTGKQQDTRYTLVKEQ